MDYKATGGKQILDLHELEELKLVMRMPKFIKKEPRNGMTSESLGENL